MDDDKVCLNLSNRRKNNSTEAIGIRATVFSLKVDSAAVLRTSQGAED